MELYLSLNWLISWDFQFGNCDHLEYRRGRRTPELIITLFTLFHKSQQLGVAELQGKLTSTFSLRGLKSSVVP